MQGAPEEFTFEQAGDLVARLEREVSRVIIGQRPVVREVLTCLLAGGHCLLRGVPGLAKTLLIKTLAEALSLRFNRIQFTPDLMPSDILGAEVIEEDTSTGKRSIRFIPGPVFANTGPGRRDQSHAAAHAGRVAGGHAGIPGHRGWRPA